MWSRSWPSNDQWVERRQLGCLDLRGLAAGRTGSGNREWAGHRADRNVLAAANAVVGPGVVEAMYEAFVRTPERPLWERLLDALEAGKQAGGEPNGEKSSGLYVVDREPYAMVDLRVDLHPEPVAELRRMADDTFRWSRTTTSGRQIRTCRARQSGWRRRKARRRAGSPS